MTGREVEAAFVITAPDALMLAGDVAALTAVPGYALIAGPAQGIRDIHVDTADRALAARLVAVRVRTIDGVDWLTLKGPPRPTAWGAQERVEFEEPWSPDALLDVVGLLRQADVRLRAEPPTRPGPTTPESVLGTLGLVPIQRRETYRRPRRVVPLGDPRGAAPAEMDVDVVTYWFHRRDVRLCAVEVEVRCPDGHAASAAVTRYLLERYEPLIRPWPYGKLATGMVIEDLLARGALDQVLADDRMLRASGFDLIEARLARRVDAAG